MIVVRFAFLLSLSLALVVGLTLLEPAAAAGQQRTPVLPDTAAFAAPPGMPSPRGAMLRSLVLPGWGQAETGSYLRGGIYFAASTASWFMLGKTLGKLGEAREIEGRRVQRFLDSLAVETGEPAPPRNAIPDSLLDPIAADSLVADMRDLVASREQQREDWIAQVIFWTLASALDAYVTTQLADFPGEIATERRSDGAITVRYALPARRFW